MASKKNSFILYDSFKDVFDELNDEQAGRLIKAIFEYKVTGSEPELDGLLKMAFIPIRQAINRDIAKYEATCKRNRESIKKRWNSVQEENIPDDTRFMCGLFPNLAWV